jgi:hypothetical protein
MKKTAILLLIFASTTAFACGGYGDLYPKWAIGVIGYGYTPMAVTGMHGNVLSGVQLSHKNPYSRWTQRVAFEYNRYAQPVPEFPDGSADMLYTTGRENRFLLRAGVERGWFLYRFFQPYAAMDLGFQYDKYDMALIGGIAGFNEHNLTITKGVGLMPAIGIKSEIGRKVSVFAEYRAEAFVNDVDTKVINYKGNVDTRPTSETKFAFNAGNIVQAGIQVMF